MRTDEHNNPAAITTDVAAMALRSGIDYTQGAAFEAGGHTLYTAKLLGDPVVLTIQVIDAIGFFTRAGAPRWAYIAVPKFLWSPLTADQKRDVIGEMYRHEGGVALRHLFPRYGQLPY